MLKYESSGVIDVDSLNVSPSLDTVAERENSADSSDWHTPEEAVSQA